MGPIIDKYLGFPLSYLFLILLIPHKFGLNVVFILIDNHSFFNDLGLLLTLLDQLVFLKVLDDSVVFLSICFLSQLSWCLPFFVNDECACMLFLYQVSDVQTRIALGNRGIMQQCVTFLVGEIYRCFAILAKNRDCIELSIQNCQVQSSHAWFGVLEIDIRTTLNQ